MSRIAINCPRCTDLRREVLQLEGAQHELTQTCIRLLRLCQNSAFPHGSETLMLQAQHVINKYGRKPGILRCGQDEG